MVKIGQAARLLGTTPAQLRRWEATGELVPARKTRGGTRYYTVADLLGDHPVPDPSVSVAETSVCYCRLDLDQPAEQAVSQIARQMLDSFSLYRARLRDIRSPEARRLLSALSTAEGVAEQLSQSG